MQTTYRNTFRKLAVANRVFDYAAFALIKPKDLKINGQPIAPCVPGNTITQIYKTANDKRVIPMISGDAYTINTQDITKPDQKSALTNLATVIASAINSDPNTSGVAFDLEGPSLGKGSNKAVINATYFITTLANKLENNRVVALYDGENILRTLASKQDLRGKLLELKTLYDAGNAGVSGCDYSPYSDNQPLPPTFFQTCGLNANIDNPPIPVMYVVPAAATTQLYESVETMNTSIPLQYAKANKSPTLGHSTSLEPQANCLGYQENLQTYEGKILANWIGSAPVHFPAEHSTQLASSYTVAAASTVGMQAFYAAGNCTHYKNNSIGNKGQGAYLTIALDKVTPQLTDPLAIGAVLYTWKTLSQDTPSSVYNPNGFNSVTCSQKYFVPYLGDATLLKTCLARYPDGINQSSWDAYNTWVSDLRTMKTAR